MRAGPLAEKMAAKASKAKAPDADQTMDLNQSVNDLPEDKQVDYGVYGQKTN